MKPQFIHELVYLESPKPKPFFEVAHSSPFGYRIRMDGKEIGPKIGTEKVAHYLADWLEHAWEDMDRD